MTKQCTRCGAELPNDPATDGFRYLVSLETENRNTLHFVRWNFNGYMNGHSTTTDLQLCNECAVDVLLYAQGEEPTTDAHPIRS